MQGCLNKWNPEVIQQIKKSEEKKERKKEEEKDRKIKKERKGSRTNILNLNK